MAQRLVRRTWDLKVSSSSPGRCVYVVFLGKKLLTLTVPLSSQVYKWEPANCFGNNLEKLSEVSYGSIPPRESRNTSRRFIPQKPEISAGSDQPSGSPSWDGTLYKGGVFTTVNFVVNYLYGNTIYCSKVSLLNYCTIDILLDFYCPS